MDVKYTGNNLNFGTKIKFVSPKGFEKIVKHAYNRNESSLIWQYSLNKRAVGDSSCFRTDMKFVYTRGIRTCTNFLTKFKDNTLKNCYAHLFHSQLTKKNIPMIEDKMVGDSVIIIGSKRIDKAPFSSQIFNKIKSICKSKKMSVSIFQGLDKYYEANTAYNAKSDKLYVCFKNIDNNEYVRNKKDLRESCKIIRLSKNDSIEFLNNSALARELRLESMKEFFAGIFHPKCKK